MNVLTVIEEKSWFPIVLQKKFDDVLELSALLIEAFNISECTVKERDLVSLGSQILNDLLTEKHSWHEDENGSLSYFEIKTF